MDHLNVPQDSLRNLRIPFLAQLQYDGRGIPNGFANFPFRHSFNLYAIDSSRTIEEISSIIQSWLFFGLLEEYLQEDIDRSLFVFSDTSTQYCKSGQYLTTIALQNLKFKLFPCQYDINEEDDADEDDFQFPGLDFRDLESLLNIAEYAINTVDQVYSTAGSPLDLVLLCTKVPLNPLNTVCLGKKPLEWTSSPRPQLDIHESLILQLIQRTMKANGWCLSQIDYILDNVQTPLAIYIVHTRRHLRPGITHEDCSQQSCQAFNINPNEYKTHHVESDCNCEHVSIPVEQMRQIIRQGGIPQAEVFEGKEGKISLM